MVESAILDVCGFLKAKHILIPSQNLWLRGSIACFRESNRNCSANQLKDFVFTQWKLADLRDVSASSLPANCQTAAKLMLPGKYAVQINYVMNVGESFYKQLQKIRRPTAEDNLSVDSEVEKTSTEISANRTLKFEITDGSVTLLGFEDKQIKKLVEPFVPGVKAILSGPIECRKGVLFIKNDNIDLLGGEVDTLHIPNAAENLLARAIKQPENPDPYKSLDSNGINNDPESLLDIPQDDDAFLQIPDDFGVVLSSSAPSTMPSNNGSSRNYSTAAPSNTQQRTYTGSSRSECTNVTNFISNTGQTAISDSSLNDSVIELDDDDEFALMAAQTALLAEKTHKVNQSSNSKQTSLHTFFSNNNKSSEKRESQKATSSSNIYTNDHERKKKCDSKTKSAKPSEIDLREQLEESYSSFMISENQSGSIAYTSIFKKDLSKISSETKNISSNCKLNSAPPNPLESRGTSQLEKRSSEKHSFPPTKFPCVLTVHAAVESVGQKLSILENQWNLSAILRIQGNEMEVDFSPQVLENIIGMTAVELKSKRKEVKHNLELKDKLNDQLKSSQKRISKLDSDMKIKFISYIAKPIVLEIFE